MLIVIVKMYRTLDSLFLAAAFCVRVGHASKRDPVHNNIDVDMFLGIQFYAITLCRALTELNKYLCRVASRFCLITWHIQNCV